MRLIEWTRADRVAREINRAVMTVDAGWRRPFPVDPGIFRQGRRLTAVEVYNIQSHVKFPARDGRQDWDYIGAVAAAGSDGDSVVVQVAGCVSADGRTAPAGGVATCCGWILFARTAAAAKSALTRMTFPPYHTTDGFSGC